MRQIIIHIATAALLCGCSVYRNFDCPEIATDSLYRDAYSPNVVTDTVSLGDLSWREMFRDPKLQQLISQGIASNVDLQSAQLRVEQAAATLMSARLAFVPSFTLSPEGALSRYDGSTTKTYGIPLAASWEVDIFGSLRNAKQRSKAVLAQSKAYRQAVQTQLVATIADGYYTLLMLDRQLAISRRTAENWKESVETMRSLKEAGIANEAAVTQSEASYRSVRASIPDLEYRIRETENALCSVLGQTPQKIDRGTWRTLELPGAIATGIPLRLLSARPDIKQAEMALASAYYTTNEARATFYPRITINGTGSWTNNAGAVIANPGKLLLSAVGSLVQPIFNRGLNRAKLRVAKAQQQEALLEFQQSLLNAGEEVSNACYRYTQSERKLAERREQLVALHGSVAATQELMRNGDATYLEVLTAQQSLLAAQLSESEDEFEQVAALVSLYRALGGGREIEAQP